VSALGKAAISGRSPFLKTDVYRILSILFASKPNPTLSEAEKIAADIIKNHQQELLTAITSTLQDEEMKKPKRARTVLKAVEKFIPCIEFCSSECLQTLDTLKSQILKLESSENNSIKSACKKLGEEIDCKINTIKKEHEKVQQETVKNTSGSASGSKKKKKKKKKR